MMVTMPGFIGPGFIARYVLRTPDAIDSSQDHRVFTAAALFAPVLASFSLVGFLYAQRLYDNHSEASNADVLPGNDDNFDDDSLSLSESVVDERLALLFNSDHHRHKESSKYDECESESLHATFDPIIEAYRHTSTLMNIQPQINVKCNNDQQRRRTTTFHQARRRRTRLTM